MYWVWVIVILAVLAALLYFVTGSAPKGAGTTATSAASAPVTFYCGQGNTLSATFGKNDVVLALSDGTNYTLPQTMSGSGIRYEYTSTGADIVFASKGDTATLSSSASTTDMRYSQCTAANVTNAATAGYDLYTDRSEAFSFEFPTEFQVTGTEMGYSQAWAQDATTSGQMLARIYVPQSFEAGTNFADAWLTVGVSSDPSAIATCLENPAPVPNATSAQATIDNLPFTKLTFAGAGAGNRYDTTSYRIVRDNQCYAVEYTVHYGVLQNFPKGSVKAFDEAKVRLALDAVAKSFQFLQ